SRGCAFWGRSPRIQGRGGCGYAGPYPEAHPRRRPRMSGRTSGTLLAALLLAAGLAVAGWFAAQGMAKLRTADRFVTVKGSAEKIVDADLVVWPLSQTVGGDQLEAVQAQLEANTATIRQFLA